MTVNGVCVDHPFLGKCRDCQAYPGWIQCVAGLTCYGGILGSALALTYLIKG